MSPDWLWKPHNWRCYNESHDLMSYTRVRADICRDAAKAAIERIEKMREESIQDLIKKRMNSRWFPAKTKEQALRQIEKEDNQCGFSNLWLVSFQGSATIGLAEELLHLAEIADDTVMVTERHASMVNRYLDELGVNES